MKRAVTLALVTVCCAAAQQTGDALAKLNAEIGSGKAQLKFDDEHGYLLALLEALHVPLESQMLVFSKTSSQAIHIEPRNPRAIYFNDSVVVGWVNGGLLEVMAQSPDGAISFYTADQRPWVNRERIAKASAAGALFDHREDCLHCHGNTTSHVPGALVLSVFPSPDGVPISQLGVTPTDHRTPIEKLWGGWFVTGVSAAPRHMGNGTVTDLRAAPGQGRFEAMRDRFDPAAYPSPYSDIAALMVFEHQMTMMNLLAAAHVRDNVNELVDYLLFIDEPPLKGKIEGTSGFTQTFAASGVLDKQGRSLRQLDLNHRLMQYPCSYMIYADAFDELPAPTKEAIYKRMWRILSGENFSPKYARLSLEDRRAVVDILRDTKKNLPSFFKPL